MKQVVQCRESGIARLGVLKEQSTSNCGNHGVTNLHFKMLGSVESPVDSSPRTLDTSRDRDTRLSLCLLFIGGLVTVSVSTRSG